MPVPKARQHLDECKILSLCRYRLLISKSKKAQLGSLVRVAASATPRAKFQPTLNLMTTLKVTSSACQVQRHDCSAFASKHDPCCRCSRRWNHLATDSEIELFGGSGGFWMVLCIRLLPTGAA